MIYIRQFFGFVTVELAYSTFKIIFSLTHFFCSGVTVAFDCEIGVGAGDFEVLIGIGSGVGL
jgi:hypothetical protein